MLFAQLQEITELDKRINQMHEELAALYRRRHDILDPAFSQAPVTMQTFATLPTPEKIAEQEYLRLQAQWQRIGLAIPSRKILKRRLIKANEVKRTLGNANSELKDNMAIVLIPPTSSLAFPFTTRLRKHQPFVLTDDYVCRELTQLVSSNSWRVLLVYDKLEGLALQDPHELEANDAYLLAGYDLRALGVYEYAVFSLHCTEIIDKKSWTILFAKDGRANLRPCVTFTANRFFFDLDDMGNLFGDDYFRPAVEID